MKSNQELPRVKSKIDEVSADVNIYIYIFIKKKNY